MYYIFCKLYAKKIIEKKINNNNKYQIDIQSGVKNKLQF